MEEEKVNAENGEKENIQPQAEETAATEEKTQETETKKQENENSDGGKYGKVFFYIALACTVLGAVFFGLTFTPLAVYSLCASILFCLVSLSLLSKIKKNGNVKYVKPLTIVTYVLMGIFLAFFVGGLIWSAVT